MKTPIQIGTHRLRNGDIVDVKRIEELAVAGIVQSTGEHMAWDKQDGMFSESPGPWDLVERLPDAPEELPPALNSAVKAAEDRVRELNYMVAQTAAAWATARRLREAAQRELERLEKECEVKP